jgi:thioredoxin 1
MAKEITSENFPKEVLGSAVPVLVDFWSPGCGPCRMQAPIVEELATEGEGRFHVGQVNVWEQPELAAKHQISAVPTLLVFHAGKAVDKLVGFHAKPALLKALRRIEEPVSRR